MKPVDFLTEKELGMVAQAVKEAEAKTSGEIRVKIMSGLDKGIKTSREQAIQEFYKEGMDKTRGKTGVLILLVLSKKAIEILADSGINEKVELGIWDTIVKVMSVNIHLGERCAAVCNAVKTVGEILSCYFPRKPDDVDELPNRVIVDKG